MTAIERPASSRRGRRDATERGRCRKNQRLDDHRHGARRLEHRADVDEVEFLEDDPVDRHDRIWQLRLLLGMDADEPADIAVADENQRQAMGELLVEPACHAAAEIVEPPEGRRSAPAIAERDGLLALVKIEPSQRRADRAGDRLDVEVLAVERHVGGDDRHVAQRQNLERPHENRAAADLDRILRGADDGRPNAFVGRFDAWSPGRDPAQDRLREQRAEVAETLALAPVDIFRHAAGKGDRCGSAGILQAVEPQERGRAGAQARARNGFEETLGHALDHSLETFGSRLLTHFESKADLVGKAAAGLLDAHHPALAVESDDPRADIDRGHFDEFARRADADLRRAAAEVDIHHPHAFADRARGGARTESGERGLEPVAGTDRHELAGLGREKLADRPRIAAPHGDARQDQCAGVDRLRIEFGQFVLTVDEPAQRIGIDRRIVGIGRQQDVEFVHDLALRHDVAIVEPLQHQPRKDEMGGRRADVDTDAHEADLVLLFEAPADIGEEDASANRFIGHHKRSNRSRSSSPAAGRCSQLTVRVLPAAVTNLRSRRPHHGSAARAPKAAAEPRTPTSAPSPAAAKGSQSDDRHLGVGIRRLLVPLGVHAAGYAVFFQRRLVFGTNIGILHPIGNGGAALVHVDGRVIGMLLARRAGIAAGIVRAEPGGQAEIVLRDAEMLVVPAIAAGRRRDHADRLVIETADLIGISVLPRLLAAALRPAIGIALALEADQNRRRRMRMRLRIAAVLMLADPEVEAIIGHERLDAAVADRAAVVERQFTIDHVRDEVGLAHGEPAHRIGLDVVLRLEEVVGAVEAVAEDVRIVEDRAGIVEHVDDIGRRGAGEQQRPAGGGVDEAVHGVHRNREHRSLLPFEDVSLAVSLDPDLGRCRGLRRRGRFPRTYVSRG